MAKRRQCRTNDEKISALLSFLNAYDDIGFSLMFMTYNFRTTYNTSVHIKYIRCKAILHVSKIQLKQYTTSEHVIIIKWS